jgi:glycerol transport system substrate-binding protein
MTMRYTALAAAVVLTLAACGKKEEAAAPPAAPAATAPAPAAPAAPAPAAAPASPSAEAAKKWIDSEFTPSTLTKDQQMAELKWFSDAAATLKAKGVNEISVVSETITTHEYESKTMAKAFEEITGIKVKHDLSRSTTAGSPTPT